ncbi:DUF305 domain-containing protein [Leucobacter sp. wl10]|uniref:DUF305 domain-containing protein n=1 Tax=Leucobacter sp. wl10 TaxID=2304677 RepID=UPI00352A37B0
MPGMDHGSTPMPSGSASASAQFNSADEMFVTMMIPHHQQAIDMADAILSKDGVDEQVLTLAQQIKDAQGPEIETMRGWLEDWGIRYNESSGGGMPGMDPGGMMSEKDMAALETATGAEAARLFLEGMIVHHQGAIDMAQTEVDSGQNPEAIELAQQVIDGQSAEIETMRAILERL